MAMMMMIEPKQGPGMSGMRHRCVASGLDHSSPLHPLPGQTLGHADDVWCLITDPGEDSCLSGMLPILVFFFSSFALSLPSSRCVDLDVVPLESADHGCGDVSMSPSWCVRACVCVWRWGRSRGTPTPPVPAVEPAFHWAIFQHSNAPR